MNATLEDNADRQAAVDPRTVSGADLGTAKPAGPVAKARAALRRWASWIRFAVSAGLIYLILLQTSLAEIAGLVEQSLERWPVLLVALLLPGIGVGISALRWGVLLNGLGARPRLRSLYYAILVGTFFNQVLPSTIGGDVARGLLLQRSIGSATLSLAVVGLDRLIGVLGMGAPFLGTELLDLKIGQNELAGDDHPQQ